MEQRLQKRIADSGYCSRRKAESLIEQGKVKVNGKIITTLGTKVSEIDKIEVNNTPLAFVEKLSVALNKPADYICSKSDPYHSKTIMDLLPKEFQHLKPAGRLDKDSEGIIILSSDGSLIQELTHPKHEHKKTYEVVVKGFAQDKDLKALTSGKLKLDNYQLNPMQYKIKNTTKDRKTWLQITLSEGRNRQIRRVMDSLGFPVLYLRRIAIGKLQIKDLEKGKFKILSENEIQLALS